MLAPHSGAAMQHALLHTSAKVTFPSYSWRSRSTRTPNLLYITDHLVADRLLANIPHGPVGFDLEWRPSSRRGQREFPVALIQLATADTVILLHLCFMSQLPAQLERFLLSTSWIKAGVSIRYDCAKLHRDYRLSVSNCVELSLLARTVDNARWKGKYTNSIGLARLVETYEQATLLKGNVQRSNWERQLTRSQQEYAANDAHAGYVLYSRLINMAQTMDPVPPPTYYSFSLIGGLLRDSLGNSPWEAHNPDYDPGPPPPVKSKNPDKDNPERPDSAPVVTELQDGV